MAIRRLNNKILAIPYAHDEDHWRGPVIDSSPLFNKRGVPAFSEAQYETLKEHVRFLPDYSEVIELTGNEFLRVFQLEAPGSVLGHLGSKIIANPDYFLAVVEGDIQCELGVLNSLLWPSNDVASSLITAEFDRDVEFVLDLPDCPHWVPFGYKDGRPYLKLCFGS